MATFNGDPGLTREELESIRAPVEKALTLPARAFTSDAFFDLEVKRIFHHHWMALCFETTLPNPGDMRPIELFGPAAGAGPWRRRNPAAFHNICPYDGCLAVRTEQQAATGIEV